MTTLFIDGKQAVFKEGQTLKLVREDTYFTKSGTYTYDIILPVCPENIAIFGALSRKDISKGVEMKYKALLVVNNRDILNGTATITNISEEEIKVQLMGGNSELNFYTKNENRYLDELELGTWYDDEGITSSDLTMRTMAERIQSQFNSDISSMGLHQAYKKLCRRLWNENTKDNLCKWVALPCWNENHDVTCNNFGIKHFANESAYYTCINDIDSINLSAQPYLVPMIERIFEHLGYPIVENSLRENEFFMHLVIVTANNRSAIARALPHWTIKEFIEEIENLFAVVIHINEATKQASIKYRGNFFEEHLEYIDDVVEEYSVEVDSENLEDIANANVGYSEVSEYDRIETDIKELAKYDYSFDNADFSTGLQNLTNHLYNLRRNDRTKDYSSLFKYKGTIFKICGRSVIIELYDYVDEKGGAGTYYNHAKVLLVDEFANRINVDDKTDVDIELKICPAKYRGDGDVAFYDEGGAYVGTNTCYHLVKADNTDPAGIDDETKVYIAGLISGETEKVDTKEDLMSICLYDGGFVKRDFTGDSTQEYFRSFLTQVAHPNGAQCFYPSGYLMSTYTANTYTGGGQIQKFANESLALNIDSFQQNIGGKMYTYRTFYSEVFKKLNRIDTQVKYCINFITDRIDLPVNSTFIIRNRKFVCEKLEYSVKAKGAERLVTGYFYELEE